MPSVAVIRTLLREITTVKRAPRVPEPDLIMDEPSKVAAYNQAGRIDGVMAPVYLFHCAQICEVIRPGDFVVDLACGPANQLALVARLNPEVRFLGIDLSEPMLARARELATSQGLGNVEFRHQDISKLESIPDRSADAVMTTMALHHLPTAAHLQATFAEIGRILKPGSGLYLVDFGRLKSKRSMQYFAHQYADRQPELFTVDYLNSLRAAFSFDDFRAAATALIGKGQLHSTFLSPYMIAFKSHTRRDHDPVLLARLRELMTALPAHHRTDLGDLMTFFALGGLKSRLLRASAEART